MEDKKTEKAGTTTAGKENTIKVEKAQAQVTVTSGGITSGGVTTSIKHDIPPIPPPVPPGGTHPDEKIQKK
jgi:hypothetical protein